MLTAQWSIRCVLRLLATVPSVLVLFRRTWTLLRTLSSPRLVLVSKSFRSCWRLWSRLVSASKSPVPLISFWVAASASFKLSSPLRLRHRSSSSCRKDWTVEGTFWRSLMQVWRMLMPFSPTSVMPMIAEASVRHAMAFECSCLSVLV